MECTAAPVYSIALIVALVIIGGALLLMYLDGFFSHRGAAKRAMMRQYKVRMRWGDYDDAQRILRNMTEID